MIAQYTFENKIFHFINSSRPFSKSNVFTILVGKNGTGKSRLLGAIVDSCINDRQKHQKSSLQSGFWGIESNIVTTGPVENIITISTSPFDRFPLPKFRRQIKDYSYLGIRDLMTQNFGLAYVARISASLIEALIHKPEQIKYINNALDELGFKCRMTIQFYTRASSKLMSQIVSSKTPVLEFQKLFGRDRPAFVTFNRRFFENEDGSISKTKVAHLVKAFERIRNSSELSKGYALVEIDESGVHAQYSFAHYFEDLVFFINSGIIKLKNFTVEKKNGEHFSIIDASSGEQSAVVSILGIASKIKNNSLICIDEPEICLHPEWQEKYIELLVKTFRSYIGCHFIIATHSPQIVSNLDSKNSFVLSMEDQVLRKADQFVRHSADFQLAKVFKSPGFRNEFLSRIALNVFTKAAKNKEFDAEDRSNLKLLSEQLPQLSKEDPVGELINAIKELFQIYGRNK